MTRYGAQFGPDITYLGVDRCDLTERSTYEGADVVMMLRLQNERMEGQFIPSPREYRAAGLLASLSRKPPRDLVHRTVVAPVDRVVQPLSPRPGGEIWFHTPADSRKARLIDAAGRVVAWGTADGHVLLEDHDPAMIGNPLAVVHGASFTAVDEAARLLQAT